MKNIRFKQAYDAVLPDAYMESRLWENIKDEKKKRFPFKAVISCALAFAVVAAGAGGIYYSTTYTDRPFSVAVVYADSGIAELDNGTVSMPEFTVSADWERVLTDNDAGFSVYAENIESVEYKTKNGSLIYADQYGILHKQMNREYYAAVIPVSNADADQINLSVKHGSAESALADYMQSHDVSVYFSGSTDSLGNYIVDFLKCSDVVGYYDEPGYAFFLTELGKITEDYMVAGTMAPDGSDSITVKYYDIPEEIVDKSADTDLLFHFKLGEVGYVPSAATDALLSDPDMDKSKLPADEITITVTFKDGKKARKTVNVSFDKDGVAQFVMK